jgi:hypothetical protein
MDGNSSRRLPTHSMADTELSAGCSGCWSICGCDSLRSCSKDSSLLILLSYSAIWFLQYRQLLDRFAVYIFIYPFCGFALCLRTCVVVQMSFRLTHEVQPSLPEFHRHRRFRLRQRSQACRVISVRSREYSLTPLDGAA